MRARYPSKTQPKKFGVHRLTVTAHVQRHGVELRQVGLAPEDITTAALLYGQGWSLARLGERGTAWTPRLYGEPCEPLE